MKTVRKIVVAVGIGTIVMMVIGVAILSHNASIVQIAQAGSRIYIDPDTGGIIMIAKLGSRIMNI